MFTQTKTTFVVVSHKAEEVIRLGRRHHWRFRIIPDFQGVIDEPIFNAKGDWVYMPLRALDEAIIPKAAFTRHATVEKEDFRVAQIIIGHEIKVAPAESTVTVAPPAHTSEIDWGNVAQVAGKGLLVGMLGLAMVSIYALIGAAQLIDPSYCIVLDDEQGTVVELIRWNLEA
jgi:hypothetical protein